MSAEENKSLVRRYLEEVWQKGNPDAVDDFLAPNYRRYLSPTAPPLDLDGQRQRLTGFRAAFPDIQLTIEDMFAEDDRVAFRSTMRGTHRGVFQGIAPTGRHVTVSLIDIVRVENGKFAEHVFDRELNIGEGCAKAGKALSLPIERLRCRGRRKIAPVVRREKCIHSPNIPLLPYLFEVPAHERFVVFC